MHRTAARLVLLLGVVFALVAAGTASAAPVPGDCQNDSKLIGAIELSTDDRAGTWWRLTKDGLEASGVFGDAAQLSTINGWFGTSFTSLADAVELLVDLVRAVDANGNNYVCASTLRGTRAVTRDPNINLTAFSVIDDKHVKD